MDGRVKVLSLMTIAAIFIASVSFGDYSALRDKDLFVQAYDGEQIAIVYKNQDGTLHAASGTPGHIKPRDLKVVNENSRVFVLSNGLVVEGAKALSGFDAKQALVALKVAGGAQKQSVCYTAIHGLIAQKASPSEFFQALKVNR